MIKWHRLGDGSYSGSFAHDDRRKQCIFHVERNEWLEWHVRDLLGHDPWIGSDDTLRDAKERAERYVEVL